MRGGSRGREFLKMRSCFAFGAQRLLKRRGRKGIVHVIAVVKFVFQISKGIIRDMSVRRMTMFVVVIAALVMLFAGATFLNEILVEHHGVFIGYWLACALLTLLAMLLALYDLIALRLAALRERKRLKSDIF